MAAKHLSMWRLSRIFLCLVAATAACGATVAETASAAPATQVVSYHGDHVTVPASWPVFHLTAASRTCVRFNRHAVYLGNPGQDQDCPVAELGRTEAVLIQPLGSAVGAVSGGDSANVVDRAAGVLVTATWNRDPAVIRTALDRRSLTGLGAAPRLTRRPSGRFVPDRRSAQATPATPGEIFSGQGFDACSAPSQSVLADWSSSPYDAVGIYIGGQNMACSQGNLTSSWVSQTSAEGWHMIPIYVGLQAPSNSCGCAAITPADASSQGATAAAQAVTEAQAIGIGPGNPLYYDMEGYDRDSANTTAVLAFLEAWDQGLNAAGYLSGVYSSDDSGIADLVSQVGTGYTVPDEIWFAAWNGGANTEDSVIPPGDWSDNQRVHQYEGNVNATYGGATLNIDEDDLDGATAAAGGASGSAAPTTPPSASSAPTITGTPVVGNVLTETHATWSGSPTSYAYQWYICNSIDVDCSALPGITGSTFTVPSGYGGYTLEVSETAINASGSGTAVMSAATPLISATALGYLAYTHQGGVYNSVYEPWFGSVSSSGVNDIEGLASDSGHNGYWLVARHGTVLNYGGAPHHPALHVGHSVIGIVPTAHGGYWLYTAEGNVYPSAGSASFGSPVISGYHLKDVVGMAATPDAKGYWLVTRLGTVLAYGDARYYPPLKVAHAIKGIVATPHGGYWLYTAQGNVYASKGVSLYGGPVGKGVDVAGMVATPHGRGYWMISTTGTVYDYGQAPGYPALTIGGTVAGLSG